MPITLDGTTGATVPAVSDSGNWTFTGTGNRITGDFSNATLANRVMFQSSTVNGNTLVRAIPNGTSNQAGFQSSNGSDPANSSIGYLTSTVGDIQIGSGINGTGTYLPMTFFAGGSEQMRISTAGIVTGTAGNLMLVSGTAISSPFSIPTAPEFTGIPSWVKRITVMVSSLSPSSTSNMLVQLGSTTYTTTGYRGVCQSWGPTSTTTTSFTTGFGIVNSTGTAADSFNGLFTISLLSSNIWTCSGSAGRDNSNLGSATAGAVTLSGTLDRIRFYIDGTATFDAGSINIQYE